jgi:hypothetical protein
VRKLALAIVLVLVLVGGAVGGMAVATASNGGPTLNVSGNTAPGLVIIRGQHWTPASTGGPVDLWMDVQDNAHHVALGTPNSYGQFTMSFVVGPTTLGGHAIIAVQGANHAAMAFVITSTSQVDDRTWSLLNEIDGNFDGVTIMDTFRGSLARGPTGNVIADSWNWNGHVKHVSLTIQVENANDDDWVKIWVNTPSAASPGVLANITAADVATCTVKSYEFDTNGWYIQVHQGNAPPPPLVVSWFVTTIEPAWEPD